MNLPLHTAQASWSHFSPLVLSSKKLYSSRLRRPFPSKSIVSNISNKAALRDEKSQTISKGFNFIFLSHHIAKNCSVWGYSVRAEHPDLKKPRFSWEKRFLFPRLGMKLTGILWWEPALHLHPSTAVWLLQSFGVLSSSTCSQWWKGAGSKAQLQALLSSQTSALKGRKKVLRTSQTMPLLPVIVTQKWWIIWKYLECWVLSLKKKKIGCVMPI